MAALRKSGIPRREYKRHPAINSCPCPVCRVIHRSKLPRHGVVIDRLPNKGIAARLTHYYSLHGSAPHAVGQPLPPACKRITLVELSHVARVPLTLLAKAFAGLRTLPLDYAISVCAVLRIHPATLNRYLASIRASAAAKSRGVASPPSFKSRSHSTGRAVVAGRAVTGTAIPRARLKGRIPSKPAEPLLSVSD